MSRPARRSHRGRSIEALRATADVIDPRAHVPLAEESEAILRWLEEPGTRLVDATQAWLMPAFGAGGLRTYLATAGRESADPFADRRRLPVRQPTGPGLNGMSS